MTQIRPISDLRNKAQELSVLAHESGEPIFITKNGEGSMVLMSLAAYGRMKAKTELIAKLSQAQAEEARGHKGRPLQAVMASLRDRLQ